MVLSTYVPRPTPLSLAGTQLTIGGLVLLVVAWVGFRFIGPSLGLYALENDPNL